jgi:alpha-ketoglutarate-dependent taurine dioxygenase
VVGKPKTSTLHIHPTTAAGGFLKADSNEIDPEVSLISSQFARTLYKNDSSRKAFRDNSASGPNGWHSDITFEPVPADYSILKIIETPPSGGDTLWASGYATYDFLSEPFKQLLHNLKGTYSQPGFKSHLDASETEFYSGERGSPENVGDELTATHPIVRTNPVTGWNSVFALGSHFTSIDDVSEGESDIIKKYIEDIVIRNHDIRVRFKWNKNDVAIWDNRSAYHNATKDIYTSLPEDTLRVGVRTVGIGERPFLSPLGKSRSVALKEEGVLV